MKLKLPKSFVPEKEDIKKDLDQILREGPSDSERLKQLVDGCEEFFYVTQGDVKLAMLYYFANNIVQKFTYKKRHVKALVKDINQFDDFPRYSELGFYVSALVNNILSKNEQVTLDLPEKPLDGLGSNLDGSVLILKGDTGNWTGYCVHAGKLVVKGNSKDWTGCLMVDGTLSIEKSTGDNLGYSMKGGKIKVYGNMGKIPVNCKGKIYHKNQQVWPK